MEGERLLCESQQDQNRIAINRRSEEDENSTITEPVYPSLVGRHQAATQCERRILRQTKQQQNTDKDIKKVLSVTEWVQTLKAAYCYYCNYCNYYCVRQCNIVEVVKS